VLTAGALIPEGMAADFGTHIKTLAVCEVYRIRRSDLEVSAASMASPPEWMARFRMIESQAAKALADRGEAAHGLVKCLMKHPNDAELVRWSARRTEAIFNAKDRKNLELKEGSSFESPNPSVQLSTFVSAASKMSAGSKVLSRTRSVPSRVSKRHSPIRLPRLMGLRSPSSRPQTREGAHKIPLSEDDPQLRGPPSRERLLGGLFG